MATVAEAGGNGGGTVGAGPEPATDGKLTDDSTVIEASRVVKDSAGRVFGLSGFNGLASVQFIQLHDATSLPADATVAKYSIEAQASANFSIDFTEEGVFFENGIVVCNSTTHATKTIGAADTMFNVRYI